MLSVPGTVVGHLRGGGCTFDIYKLCIQKLRGEVLKLGLVLELYGERAAGQLEASRLFSRARQITVVKSVVSDSVAGRAGIVEHDILVQPQVQKGIASHNDEAMTYSRVETHWIPLTMSELHDKVNKSQKNVSLSVYVARKRAVEATRECAPSATVPNIVQVATLSTAEAKVTSTLKQVIPKRATAAMETPVVCIGKSAQVVHLPLDAESRADESKPSTQDISQQSRAETKTRQVLCVGGNAQNVKRRQLDPDPMTNGGRIPPAPACKTSADDMLPNNQTFAIRSPDSDALDTASGQPSSCDFLETYHIHEMVLPKERWSPFSPGMDVISANVMDAVLQRIFPGRSEVLTVDSVDKGSVAQTAGVCLGDVLCRPSEFACTSSSSWTLMSLTEFYCRLQQSVFDSTFTFHVARCKQKEGSSSGIEPEESVISLDDVIVIVGDDKPNILPKQDNVDDHTRKVDDHTKTTLKRPRDDSVRCLFPSVVSAKASWEGVDRPTSLDRVVERVLDEHEMLRTECVDLARQCQYHKAMHRKATFAFGKLYDSLVRKDVSDPDDGQSPSDEDDTDKFDIPPRLVVPFLIRSDEQFHRMQGEFIDLVRTEKMSELQSTKARLKVVLDGQERSSSELNEEFDAWAAEYAGCLNRLKILKSRTLT